MGLGLTVLGQVFSRFGVSYELSVFLAYNKHNWSFENYK